MSGYHVSAQSVKASSHVPRKAKYLDVAAKLRSNPGVWFDLLEAPSNNAAWSFQQAIRTGRRYAFRPVGEWESSVHGKTVMVRFVGSVA